MSKKISLLTKWVITSNSALWVLFAASMVTCLLGSFRLCYYSLPMWQGNYEYAATKMQYFNAGEVDENGLPLFKETTWDKMPRFMVDISWKTGDLLIGNRSPAMLNAGVGRYHEYDYISAAARFERAYTELCDKKGYVAPGNRKMASVLQMMIGNCWDNAGKKENAGPYYEQALSLDPDNLLATWLLERLQDSSGGKGGKDGEDPQPSNAAPRKRI